MVFIKDNSIIIDDVNTTSEELKKAVSKIESTDKVRIFISKNLALQDSKLFETICTAIPNSEILIKLSETEYDANFNQSQIFDKEQLKVLLTNSAVASAYGSSVSLSGYDWQDDEKKRENKIPLSKVIIASGKINKWVDEINNAKVNGKSLSPFEKYLYAYQIVTKFKYSDKDIFESRDISRVLTGDSIICVGFAQILSELCRRVGIPCKRQYIHEIIDGQDDGILRNHMECIVKIDDPKYNINGFYIADPTIDSFDTSIENASEVTHALMNIDEYENLYAGESRIVYDEPSTASYYFLRDNQLLKTDQKLIDESLNPLKTVQEKIITPEFHKEFNDFTNKIFENLSKESDLTCVEVKDLTTTHKFEKIVINQKSYTIDEISKDKKLMSALALRLYSISDSEPNIETEVMEKFLKKSYLKRLENNKIDLISNGKIDLSLFNNIKDNEFIMSDPILLAEVGRFEDFKVLTESKTKQIMEALGLYKFKSPKLSDYLFALRNVYMANGYSKEKAELAAKYIISNSIDLAYEHSWDMITTDNPFSKAVKIKYANEIKEMEGMLTPLEDENKSNKEFI